MKKQKLVGWVNKTTQFVDRHVVFFSVLDPDEDNSHTIVVIDLPRDYKEEPITIEGTPNNWKVITE